MKKIKKYIPILIILIYFIIIIVHRCSIAKNTSRIYGNSSIEIGKPIIEVESMQGNNNLRDLNDEIWIEMNVKNYNQNEEISELQQKFYIEVYTESENLDISYFDITAEVNGIRLNVNNGKTEDILLENNEKQEKKIYIIAKCNRNFQRDISGELKARLVSVQVLPEKR